MNRGTTEARVLLEMDAEAEAATGPILVIAAMARELAPLVAAAMPRCSSFAWAGCRVYRGRVASTPVLLACTGDGPLRAERGARALLQAFPASKLLAIGVSGGLSPDVTRETLLVAGEVRDRGVPLPQPPDPSWVQQALRCARAREGSVIATDRVLVAPSAKAAIYASLSLKGPAAVDLESAAYARMAALHGVPYLVVRALCDTAEEALPLDFNRFRTRDGRIARGRVAQHALLRPWLLAPLWALRGRVRQSSRLLAAFVEELLRMERN